MIPDLSQFDVVMFDLNGTFMFGQDRFGSDQDYFATYRQLGGTRLDSDTIKSAITETVEEMARIYDDPQYHDGFPQVSDVLKILATTAFLPEHEQTLISAVIAEHEIGEISQTDKAAITQIAQMNRIALVSNIWSPKDLWVDYLQQEGLYDLFETIVFSSDHICTKPSPKIYQIALDALNVAPNRVLFVGDDPVCDIQMPRSLGMTTARVRGTTQTVPQEADFVLDSVSDLLIR